MELMREPSLCIICVTEKTLNVSFHLPSFVTQFSQTVGYFSMCVFVIWMEGG